MSAEACVSPPNASLKLGVGSCRVYECHKGGSCYFGYNIDYHVTSSKL